MQNNQDLNGKLDEFKKVFLYVFYSQIVYETNLYNHIIDVVGNLAIINFLIFLKIDIFEFYFIWFIYILSPALQILKIIVVLLIKFEKNLFLFYFNF